MSRTELEQATIRQNTVLGEADRKYRELIEERKRTGMVRKYTPSQMEEILRAADEHYLVTLAELHIPLPHKYPARNGHLRHAA